MKRIVLLPLACALLVACQDQRSPTGVKPPSALLRDGAHNAGNAHFFFLPPLVKQPSVSGVFNPALKPVVAICQLNVDANNIPIGCSGAPLIDPGIVTADLAGQQYKVNWDTRQSGIAVDKFYRIQVFGSRGGLLLGFADVDPVNNGSGLKNVNTNEYIGLVDGRTLPIKFRIEQAAFTSSGNCTDCAEQTVGPAGGTVITNTSLAGVFFPPGALPRDVTVIIEASPPAAGQSCIPVNLDQFPGCYTFSTDPGPTTFNTSVTAAICVETEGLTTGQIQSLILYQLDVVGESDVVTPLENTPAAFLPCNSLARARPRGNGILGLALAGLDAIRRLVVPATLNAAHLGVGGLTGSFSRIGWGLPPTMTGVEGTNNQTAEPGSSVPNPPAVQLVNASQGFVQGLPVKFKVTSGGGKIILGNESLAESTVVRSNADGVAATFGWQLGPTVGATNTLQASQIGAIGSPVTFTASSVVRATLIDCQASVSADLISRGFYVEAFPGTRLDRVTLYLSARTTGTYTFSLTSRGGSYDGTLLGTATANVTLTAGDPSLATVFTFPSPTVSQASTVTFAISQVSGPTGADVFYDIPAFTGSTCPVVETEGTTPPLDTFRRQGIRVTIEGGAPVIP